VFQDNTLSHIFGNIVFQDNTLSHLLGNIVFQDNTLSHILGNIVFQDNTLSHILGNIVFQDNIHAWISHKCKRAVRDGRRALRLPQNGAVKTAIFLEFSPQTIDAEV
jgi:hypothetical protein